MFVLNLDFEPAEKPSVWPTSPVHPYFDELDAYVRQAIRCLCLEAKAIQMPCYMKTSYGWSVEITPIYDRKAKDNPMGIGEETFFQVPPDEVKDNRLYIKLPRPKITLAELLGKF